MTIETKPYLGVAVGIAIMPSKRTIDMVVMLPFIFLHFEINRPRNPQPPKQQKQ